MIGNSENGAFRKLLTEALVAVRANKGKEAVITTEALPGYNANYMDMSCYLYMCSKEDVVVIKLKYPNITHHSHEEMIDIIVVRMEEINIKEAEEVRHDETIKVVQGRRPIRARNVY